VTALRGARARSDEWAIAALALLGVGSAALAGAAAAGGNVMALGALGWLALVAIGLRLPGVPFAAALVPYLLVSSYGPDNSLFGGVEVFHDSLAGPLSLADSLLAAAGVAAVAAFARMPPDHRARIWTPVTVPVLALLAAGALSGLIIHREGGGAVLALFPLGRLVACFLIASILLAGGYVRRSQVVIGTIVAAEIVGAIGVLNSVGGGSDENVIMETTLPGGEAPVDEQTLAFVDAAAPFVMVFGLAALLTRTLWGESANRWLMVALGALPFAALVLSARRAMWIDFAIAAVIIVFVSARVDRRVVLAAVVALSVAGVTFVSLTQASPAYQERFTGITTVFSGDSSDSNIRSRQIETNAVWENIRRHPLEGIGLTAPYLSNVQFQYQEPTYLHNNALWIWLKFGILGLAILVWLVWKVAQTALRTARALRPGAGFTDAEMALAASATMLGFFVASLTASFLTASIRPPVIAGLLLAILGTAAAQGAPGVRAKSTQD